jgi:hypothetical protein
MMKHAMQSAIFALLVAIPLAAAAYVEPFPRIPPYLPVPRGAAVIMRTGSTNTSGYRIVVQRSGASEYITSSGRASATIPMALAGKFFADFASASPLRNVGRVGCMKSASFGTSLFIWWNHERSPDLTCSADARGRMLLDDATNIAQSLHISVSPRGVMRPMLPGEAHKALPAPSPTQT